jgi:hypothetical protein
MHRLDPDLIAARAERELAAERFRAAVEAKKLELQKRKWWHRLVPFKITIEWR